MRSLVLPAAFAIFLSTPAFADTDADKICSFRPSALLGGGGAAAVGTTGTAVAAAGTAAHVAGFYTLTHAVTGATMLASAAGGASAAGTVGIMGGTAGLIGGVAAFFMAPVTIAVGAVVGVGVAGYEGLCYFADERITEHDEVLAFMQSIAENANPDMFAVWKDETNESWMIRVRGPEGFDLYKVSNLYIVNGVLMHRDWLKNTTIGSLSFILPAEDQ